MKFPWQRRKERLAKAEAALLKAETQRLEAKHEKVVAGDLAKWARSRAADRLDLGLTRELRGQG
jgi:hypothetical protein